MELYLVAHGKPCLDRGLVERAHRVFQQAVRVNPRSIGAVASLAVLEDNADNGEKAEKLWHRALSLDLRNRLIRERLATAKGSRSSRHH